LSRYVGPPTCRRKSTWDEAPLCDGCGVWVPLKVWWANARHCSPECRPDWHLVPGRACKGCGAEVLLGSGRGRPRAYCSERCRLDAEAEDKRRRRAGEPTRAEEIRFLELVLAREARWATPEVGMFMAVEQPMPVKPPVAGGRSLDRWLAWGGDWPGMVPGASEPVAPGAVLGSWERLKPQASDLRCPENS
jgi:hypothetical protein